MASGLDQWLGKLEGHNEIGEALTGQLQKAEDEVQQFLGGQAALKLSAEKVGALGAVVDQDLNNGKLSFDSELKAAEYVKKMIIRAREVALNLAEGAKAKEIAAAGKVAALKESREVVLKHTMAAKARAEQLQAAQEEARRAAQTVQEGSDSPGNDKAEEAPKESRQPRVSGQHPGRSSLDDRRAEAAKGRAAVASEEAPKAPGPLKTEPPKKRRGRPPKVTRG
jgi:hypothetical protein